FLLLLAPAGGDELQGVKRGIMEMADVIVVNKADGDLKATATRTQADYAGALRLMRKRPQDPEGYPRAMSVSALEQRGLPEVWDALKTLSDWRRDNGFWEHTRAAQARYWFEDAVKTALLAQLETPAARRALAALSDAVAAGVQEPAAAAAKFVRNLRAQE
ncbi:MAG: methylmalonyl Co-A mutase-associated GTPase MeaB, partial [Sulfitobacter sp.]|nr:methylmalonyl Co-A mutase-associated GTPase MeaB [Sulfitobacter sp.]